MHTQIEKIEEEHRTELKV